ncbi:MAG: hypothetical protein F4057_09440 [Acidobacteria bacterium]|nr:hypothetical protein [Acidobacteriota bacterium]
MTRATTASSPAASARRSAFDNTFSRQVIGSRWLTPERRSTRLSARAWNAISSMVSRTNGGTVAPSPASAAAPRATHASWAVMATASLRVRG